jgi:hypothetical protein
MTPIHQEVLASCAPYKLPQLYVMPQDVVMVPVHSNRKEVGYLRESSLLCRILDMSFRERFFSEARE